MAISRVQSVSVVNTTGTVTHVSISASGSGNLLVVTFIGEGSGGAQSIVSITDNVLNSYIQVPGSQDQVGFFDTEIWYCKNCTSGATTLIITIGNSVGSGDCVIGVIEFSGASTTSPIELGTTFGSSGPPQGPSITTSSNGSALVATCFPESTGASGVSSPWTAFAGSLEFNAYYIPGASGTYQANFLPTTSQTFLSSGASFLPPSSVNPAVVASTFLVF